MMMSNFHGACVAAMVAALGVMMITALTTASEECKAVRCPSDSGGGYGPLVRFPFWLKGHQPKHCGYPHPNFQLSCSSNTTTTTATVLELFHSVNLSSSSIMSRIHLKYRVQEIDYKHKTVRVSPDLESFCPLALNNTPPPDQLLILVDTYYSYSITLWNCSSWDYGIESSAYTYNYLEWFLIDCLSGPSYKVIATSYVRNYDVLTLCEKMYPFDLDFDLEYKEISQILKWKTPLCEECEAQGKICSSNNNNSATDLHDYDYGPKVVECSPKGKSTWVTVVEVVAATFVLLLVTSSAVYLIMRLRKKKEDHRKIEKFLEDYRALRPSRFSYADVKKITANFKDKLGEGGYGTVFKGNLYNNNHHKVDDNNNNNSIPVAVKVLHNFKGSNHNNNGEEFVNEVGTIGTIHHVNVVRLIGYCADGCRGALLYEFLPNGSLEKLLSSRKLMSTIGNWVKLCDIATGVAKGLDYLHQGCNQRILHFDIKPQNILLDENFNPKVSDFGLAKLCSKDQSAVSMTAARGTIGYIAPEVFSRNFGNVSYKSDVYSFGMLLVDMVGGRKTIRSGEAKVDNGSNSQMYFPEWMYKKLERGDDIQIEIDNNVQEEEGGGGGGEIEDEESARIFKKLAMVGLWCIQWCPADRPSMKVAIQMLESENLPTLPPNPFAATATSRSRMHNAFMTSIPEEILDESEIEISS